MYENHIYRYIISAAILTILYIITIFLFPCIEIAVFYEIVLIVILILTSIYIHSNNNKFIDNNFSDLYAKCKSGNKYLKYLYEDYKLYIKSVAIYDYLKSNKITIEKNSDLYEIIKEGFMYTFFLLIIMFILFINIFYINIF